MKLRQFFKTKNKDLRNVKQYEIIQKVVSVTEFFGKIPMK